MDERKEEDSEKDFDENGFDPTKEAFFTDLIEMEEEVATEAFELVEHALHLVKTKYFEDSIEILRQAIGLYSQINRPDEIKAINEKISEVYLLKEQVFREKESEIEKDVVKVVEKEEVEFSEESEGSNIEIESIKEEIKPDFLARAEQLIKDGNILLETNKFEEALDKYDESVEIFEEVNNTKGVDRVFQLIEECYTKKAEFLQNIKKVSTSIEGEKEQEQKELTDEELKEEKLYQYLISKKKEEEISSKAYDILGKAAELANTKQFDESLQKYMEGVKLFEELNWTYEVKKIQDTINQLENEKLAFLKKFEELKTGKKEEPLTQVNQTELVEQQAIDREEQEKIDKLKRLKEIEFQRMEDDFFKAQIDNMVTEASRLAREYELDMQKAIKKGEIVEECVYPEVIQIYEKIKKLLIDKEWGNEAIIYDDTISIYIQKQEQDKKIRQIEVEKVRKQKEAEDFLKMKKVDEKIVQAKPQIQISEEGRRKEIEAQELRAEFNEITKRAERLTREYEVALRKGRFELKCPYPEIINIYKTAMQKSVQKGWEIDVEVFASQIKLVTEKLEKDKRLRQIEAEKAQKQQKVEDSLKIQKEDKISGLEEEKISNIGEQISKQEVEDDFEQLLNDMVKKAELIAREYDLAMKKAVRQGKLADNPPFAEIIKIYERAKQMALSKKKHEEVAVYTTQINFYSQKWEKDKKLREIESQKVIKQRQVEEMHKVGKGTKIDDDKLRNIERRKKEEKEFEREITDKINSAEKLVRDHEIAMRKAMRKGEILKDTPYSEVINSYKDILKRVHARGWNEQAEIYSNQIKIYQEKLAKHVKLLDVEAKKEDRQKDIEEMHKVGKATKIDDDKLRNIERTKEEEVEFEREIEDKINIAEKLVRDHESAMRQAMRKGEILEDTPYSGVIDIYKDIREKVYAKGWKSQAEVYANQIKIYQEKVVKHEKLLEVEAKKEDRRKDIEEMQQAGKATKIDAEKLRSIETTKEEEVEFEKEITDKINSAEKLVRDHEIAMRKAMRNREIVKDTPYSDVIDIYKEIREKVYVRGWKSQAEVYANQIKIYQEKLAKHVKLLEVEAKKEDRQKDIEEMHKAGKATKIDAEKLRSIETTKEEEVEFEKEITDKINSAEKLVRDHESAMRKAMREGEILEDTPYSEVIGIYKDIREKVYARGWKSQAEVYANQIKIYQESLAKHLKLLEVEANKEDRQKEIDEMHKMKADFKPAKPEKIKEIERGNKEEDILLDNAMNLIDEAEKLVKNYEISIKTEVLLYESPYDKAISNYQEAKKIFQKIDWNEEAGRLINTIKFYKEKKEKDEKLRQLEKKKLEEPVIELRIAKDNTRKDLLAREKKILEFEKIKKEKSVGAEEIFNDINKAERMAQEYELKIKEGTFDFDPPYDEILKIYREARKKFEEIGWMEESMKLINTIKFYKEKHEKDNKLRALEIAKVKKRDEELLGQQRLQKQAKRAQERLLKQKEESLSLKKESVIKFETAKDEAFTLMDKAKSELSLNNFDKSIEYYKESEEIFSNISWQEGVNMVKDSIVIIERRKKSFELEQETLEKERLEKLKIEEKLEDKFTKAEESRKLQQEKMRKELLKVQEEKQIEKQISEEAYNLLEQGTLLLERNKFEEAYEKYIKARKLFDKISWKREVSRINNELLFKLKQEKKAYELLEQRKKKKAEEEEQMKKLKKETERERRELKKQKKMDKRKLARDEFDKKIFQEIERAEKLIDDYKYNEGILVLLREKKKLDKLARDEEIKKIDETINEVKDKAEIPLVSFESLDDIKNLEKFETTYKALDKAQISLENNRFMKAVSELNEAKANLNILKIGSKYIKEIDVKIRELQVRLGKKQTIEDSEAKELEHNAEMERLKARIAARREERRKKVVDLLKKD